MRFLFVFASVLACSAQDTPIGEVPPLPTGASATTSSTVETFAMNAIFFGETDTQGVASTNAWKAFGLNVDGLVTLPSSTDVCTLGAGTPRAFQTDGLNGIDNSWGSTVLPIFVTATYVPVPSDIMSRQIESGDWTLQMQVGGLSADAHQTASGLTAQVFVSGARDGDGTWPVLTSSLADGLMIGNGARTRFTEVYVTDGVVVARGSEQPLVIPLSFYSRPLPLRIHDPILVIRRDASGTIAGVLDTSEVVSSLAMFAGWLSSSLCGSAFNGIATELEQAPDILLDGTNASGTPCTGISIGLGFTVVPIANPTEVAADPAPLPDPCDAGAD